MGPVLDSVRKVWGDAVADGLVPVDWSFSPESWEEVKREHRELRSLSLQGHDHGVTGVMGLPFTIDRGLAPGSFMLVSRGPAALLAENSTPRPLESDGNPAVECVKNEDDSTAK